MKPRILPSGAFITKVLKPGTLNHLTIFILFLLLFVSLQSTAHPRSCPSQDILKKMMATHPDFAMARKNLEEATTLFVQNFYQKGKNTSHATSRTGLITIPVVFHIIHYGEAIGKGRNISDAQILSQLQVLNEDFRKLNANAANTPVVFKPLAADCEVEFCLVLQDPQGNPTSGINRINGGRSSFDYYQMEALKSTIAWDPNQYLNFYVADITNIALGYSTFPATPLPINDGIVCDYRTIGRAPANPFTNFYGGVYNGGRTATHEIGHWLNVFHIWGDDGTMCNGTDLVNDTPNQGGPNFGCPMFPVISCTNYPNGDMFMNFMDYSDDPCMNMFSTGQKARMSATFDNVRTGLLNSTKCQRLFLATNITAATATLTWSPYVGAVSYNIQWRVLGNNVPWTFGTSLTNTINIAGLLPYPSAYEWQVQPVYANGAVGAFSVSQLFRTMAAVPAVPCPNDPNENAIFGPYLANGVQGTGIICPAADKDRFVIMNTIQGATLRLVLTNLVLDYDIELRDAATNALLANAVRTGALDDTILYTNLQAGNYYVFIFAKVPMMVNIQPYIVKTLLLPPGIPILPGMRATLPEQTTFKFYPNPADAYVHIETGNYTGKTLLQLCNVSGTQVKSVEYDAETGEQFRLETDGLAEGMYFLQLKMEGATLSRKIKIQH
ncbi:MAG: M43 family zinc metalloprotease [Chitinophagales bacterium]